MFIVGYLLTVQLHQIHLKGDEYFALKMLRDESFNTDANYRNEYEQLMRFNGLAHDHLVTLLASFKHGGKRCLLFPYAPCALDQLWQYKEPNPQMDTATVRWVAKQLYGLMSAIYTIHEPKHLQHLTVQKYGRHGDIKPDNILWFSCATDAKGILVISDMGLSSFNSKKSRSNISNGKVLGAPGYRPPEMDVKNGKVSRTFDVWTLGCLFLEFMTWLLRGYTGVHEFGEKRKQISRHGSGNDFFFSLEPGSVSGWKGAIARVKISVIEVSL